jgi:hypothetical protein
MNKHSQLLSFLSVLALLASFVLVIFVIVPKISQLGSLSEQGNTTQQQIDLLTKKIEAIRQASGVIKSAAQDIDTLQIAIPQQQASEQALAQLSSATGTAGVQLTSVSLDNTEAGYVKVTATVFGPYDKLIVLMGDLEQNLRPVRVDDYNISTSPDSSDITTTLDISFPYIPPVKAGASVTAASTPQGGVNE